MKIRITDPNGVHFGGKVLPQGSEHDIEKGPHTAIWLRFGQVEVVKEKKSKEGDEAGAGSTKADDKKADAKK